MPQPQRIYVGTYTRQASEGVYLLELDPDTGRLSEPRLAGVGENPSFIALAPDGRSLYAVGEVGEFEGQKTGFVAAYHVEPRTGELALVNRVASGGGGPCFVEVHPSGGAVLAANYGGGSVAAFAVRDDGALTPAASVHQHHGSGPDEGRQKGPHAHSIRPDPTGRWALAADLGIDRVLVYRLDPTAATLTLRESDAGHGEAVPGGGPRHLAFHPDGRWVYVVNEMHGSVTRFDWDADAGHLQRRETVSALPDGHDGRRSGAEIAVHPTGRFVYASNRGHDSIARFAVDPSTGTLTLLGTTPSGGQEPRHFAIDPTGRWLLAANQKSDALVLFRLDPQTGELTETDARASVSMPVCVRFVP